ncbi:MAG TPA: UDP-3-O-(3-hydroxymyristoyl)glucosamine N-acyltransferase [Synergistaceae bacterium]|jgi:UDP-3-O-[3-hydroxymyristoyl] glucosamine N-acyltransferase|nr:UDP-3-O-(3-hydroxymyristoyl)glucosamine N-acyltransferase [Synergistaceae bacterium]NLL40680.1 UDP-3-O-(3-hydroxymyristoyl)glucosamine N-acyltransferase [Synergistaceae bacterium]HPX03750.1 UDP-3-O-(3-hydroxymyristoyl)glucosamine N-acyltransferase [Synergistaceae bacterium]HQA54587.1 UDP-3-O-(3-hydroxymyristoyl)glucosamine N-acyltransferase [Synergistaceae bacterium]
MNIKGLTLARISEMVGGTLKGDGERIITSITSPEAPCPGSISPLWEKKLVHDVDPEAVLLTKEGWIREGGEGVEVKDPRRALVTLLEYFDNERRAELPGTHETAVISKSAVIGRDVTIGPGCVVSDHCRIGDGCTLVGNVWLGKHVSIGDNTVIEPGVVIYDRSSLGRSCLVHANAVIGCEGFGFMPDAEKGLLRIPQIGTVVIEDGVEIGVCSSIDRGTFGETKISRGTKIDSHVKVAHNCEVGEYCIIVAQTGLAGSSTLGDRVTMAAQSGVGNHAKVGDGVVAAGRSGITNDIPSGMVVSGFPAIDHKEALRQMVALRQLPDLVKNVKRIEKMLDGLKPEKE